PEAFTIALLAGIESLLCAVVADGMTGDRHNSNTELLAQGVANIVSVCFGGIAATGALARTATNIRAGARSPLSGMIHAGVLLLIMWVAAPLATAIPMATLAAILVVVAFNMAELDHFRRMFKAPRSDALVMIVTFLLTVAVDLTLAVQVGVVLAALLFMRRMMEVTSITSARPFPLEHPGEEEGDLNPMSGLVIPEGVELFEINGPFFFGVADRLKDVMDTLEAPPRVFILRMRHVPAMDATGLSALAEFHDKCRRGGTWLVLSGVNPQPAHAMKKSGLLQNIGVENVTLDILHALTRAQTLMTSPERASD
ncbi:MAG: SulP family inorganic anion transporter, partial [Deltaproteobacteria bacterium]|nr:SulP family inorganic anion transporter [Deltaproteobacteria bacterium]